MFRFDAPARRASAGTAPVVKDTVVRNPVVKNSARPAPLPQFPVRRDPPRRPGRLIPARVARRGWGRDRLTSAQLAEVRALARILPRGDLGEIVYLGSAQDRFCEVLRGRAGQVTAAEPGPLDLEDGSADLAVLVSALDRQADPADDLAEVARVLRPGALAVVAAANVLHGPGGRWYRRSRHAAAQAPAVVAGPEGRLGHHPERLMLQLAVCGLEVERMLSAAGLSHPAWDRVLPWRVTRAAEYAAQATLAALYAGPTLFFLARKHDLG
jgi:SAM-dependent methyltransferase